MRFSRVYVRVRELPTCAQWQKKFAIQHDVQFDSSIQWRKQWKGATNSEKSLENKVVHIQ